MSERLLRLFIISLIVYCATWLVHYLYFWDIRPAAFAPETQATWRLEATFSLVSVEFVSIAVVAISAFFLLVLAFKKARSAL